ncbi:hypothetical protein N8374_00115 [Flavobacteriaceae bacterium]|nr:hypothetical protein [Flavobacteriaceae bacterium]
MKFFLKKQIKYLNSTLIFLGFLLILIFFLNPNRVKGFYSIVFGTYYTRSLDILADLRTTLTVHEQPEIFKVTMSQNEFNLLESDRLKMISNYMNYNTPYTQKRNYHKANVVFNDKKVKSKVKLFGMMPDHFRDHKGHSFRIKFNGGESFGKKTINLAKPRSLDYNTDIIFNILYGNFFNGVKINYEPVRVSFNKVDYGYYLKYDFFDKYLLEQNGFRDSYIFENHLDSISFNHVPDGFSEVSGFSNQIQKDFISLIDYEKYIFAITVSILTNDNSPHILGANNMHWFYNSVTNKIEPTIREAFIYEDGRLYVSNIKQEFNKIFDSISFDSITNSFVEQHGKIKVLNSIKNKLKEIKNYLADVLNSKEYIKTKEKLKGFDSEFLKRELLIQQNLNYLLQMANSVITESGDFKHEELIISKDTIISTDLIINKNQKLIINEGIRIILENNSNILINGGDIIISGSKESKVVIIANNSNSSIYISSHNNAIFNHVVFNGLSSLTKKPWNLPSAVTLYETNAVFSNCTFTNNLTGDDMINLFRCEAVKFDSCKFENILSDAIDSDFSNLKITNSDFSYIGNDAIDASGSNIDLDNSRFEYIKDKAISAGELSVFKSSENTIMNSELALVAKDGSTLFSSADNLLHNKLDLVMFKKKKIFKNPNAFISNTQLTNSLIAKDIYINNEKVINYTEGDIESLLYGNLYGTATKKN